MFRRRLGEPPFFGGTFSLILAESSTVTCFLSAAFSLMRLFLAAESSLFSILASTADHFLSAASGGGEEAVSGSDCRIEERGRGNRKEEAGTRPQG